MATMNPSSDVNKENANTNNAVWNTASLFGKPVAIDGSRPSIESTPSTHRKPPPPVSGGKAVVVRIPPPPKPTPRMALARTRRTSGRTQKGNPRLIVDHKLSRSKSVKGATNFPKETRLLKHKLDRLFESFQETVVATSQSQATQLESLQAENQQLQVELEALETETLRQFCELEDCAERLDETEQRRVSSHQEASMWKLHCEKLTKQVVVQQETIEAYNKQHSNSTNGGVSPPAWILQNEKLGSENESLKNELKAKAVQIRDLEQELCNAKLKLLGDDKENNPNTSTPAPTTTTIHINATEATTWKAPKDETETNASLIAARGIFGNEIPGSFLNTQDAANLTGPATKEKRHRRTSFHAMTLRGRQPNKKYH